jgi:hypothetical protein
LTPKRKLQLDENNQSGAILKEENNLKEGESREKNLQAAYSQVSIKQN